MEEFNKLCHWRKQASTRGEVLAAWAEAMADWKVAWAIRKSKLGRCTARYL